MNLSQTGERAKEFVGKLRDSPEQIDANSDVVNNYGGGSAEEKNDFCGMQCRKIGIMNNLYIHYECLGYLIDYSLYYLNMNIPSQATKNLFIYIQHYDDVEFINWKIFYNKLFNLTDENWRRSEQFDNDNIDILFLATDDDFGFKIEWINKYKIISIGHCTARQIYNDTSNFLNIYTRYSKFSNKENENWCFPVFEAVSRDEKKLIRKKNIFDSFGGGSDEAKPDFFGLQCRNNEDYDIHVVCVGLHSQPHPLQPSRMFSNNDKIKYSIINRRIIHDYRDVENIDSYESLNSELFFDLLKNADYILCFNYNTDHACVSLTGSFNLAFSFGAKLIVPEEWQENLNISSAISYNFKNTPFYLPPITEEVIDAIYDERDGYINYRNNTFNAAITTFFTG
jgi:hypothetical protein